MANQDADQRTSDSAEAFMEERHLFLAPPHPDMIATQDLTGLSDEDLMDAFNRAGAWADYLDYQLGLLTVEARRLDRAANEIMGEAVLKLLDRGIKTHAHAGRIASGLPEVKAAKERAEKAADRELLCKKAFGIKERQSERLSREITRRVNRHPQQQRAARFSA